MAKAFRVASKIIQMNGDGQPYEFCCLCLNLAGNDCMSVNDLITCDWENEYDVNAAESEVEMVKILETVVGEQVLQTISAVPYVCQPCAKQVISCYKSIICWKANTERLTGAVEDLTTCFENVSADPEHKTLFVAVDFENMSMEQLYDTRKQIDPKNNAMLRFLFIANSDKEQKEKRNKSINKDYSTIFIKTHELIHDPSKPHEYKCKMCLKVFPTSGNLRQHFFSHHFKKEFSCTLCAKQFGTYGLLQTHIKSSHSIITCLECGKNLLNRTSTIKRHQLTHSRGYKICHRCGKSYKKSNEYEKHIARDSCLVPSRTPGLFTCGDCGYHCTYKHQLLTHIKFEHTDAKGHICEYCNKKCYSASALKMHVLKHTKEKNFPCDDCGRKFVNKQSLVNHQRLHTGERPYPCAHCDQSFLSASRRKDHIERFHMQTSYTCDLCDSSYSARRSLVKHRKSHFET